MSGISHLLIGPLVGAGNELDGVSAEARVGVVSASGGAKAAATGVQGLAGVSSVAVSTTDAAQIFPAGVQGNAQIGTVVAQASAQVNVGTVSSSATVGVVNATSVREVPVTGVEATAQVNSVAVDIISNVSVTLTGVAASAQVSSVSVLIESEAFPLPANSVLIWGASGSPAPSGFTIMDLGTQDHLIMGAATIGQANTFTSTAGTLSGTANSGSTGSHSTPWTPSGANPSGSGTPATNQASSAGSHNHSVSINTGTAAIPTDTLPSGLGIKLITNASEVSEIPEDAIMFCDDIRTGFVRKTWGLGGSHNAYIARKNDVSTISALGATAKAFSLTSTSNGAHQHNTSSTTGPGGIVTGRISNVSAGGHNHPVSTPSLNLYIYQYYKHLLPFIATTDSAVRSGMIVMFKGASVPSGWSLCDGTNDTPDMRSYFLGYDDDLTTTDVVRGSRAVKTSTSAPPASGNTSSTYEPSPISATLNTVTWPHSHAGSPRNTTNQQAHYHTTKSVPHSHSVTGIPLTVPSSFLPNTFRLAFIRKD